MAGKMSKSRAASAMSVLAARFAFVSSAVALALLTSLHFLKPELDPSWRMLSEYAIGDFGWVMQAAFIAMALGAVGSFFAVRPYLSTRFGKIGSLFLLATAFGLTMAAFFTVDPITTPVEESTVEGIFHGLAAAIGMPSLPIAAFLVGRELLASRAWVAARRPILVAANLPWISVVLMFTVLGIGFLQNEWKFGSDVLIGWPNRFLMLTYATWFMTIAYFCGLKGLQQKSRKSR